MLLRQKLIVNRYVEGYGLLVVLRHFFLLCLNSFGVFILLVVAPALLLGALNVDYDIQNTKQHAIVGLVGLVVLVVLGFWKAVIKIGEA